LFNGPWGYRAQYWVSPSQGLAANGQLLAALFPKLMDGLHEVTDPALANVDVRGSLQAASAKVWIAEFAELYLGERQHLAVARWVSAANEGVGFARLGLSAPVVTTFEVKGALLDPHGNELVPASKVRRHHSLYGYGFA